MDIDNSLKAIEETATALIEAAKRQGADAADAVAVRGEALSVSVRLGKVEESERSEGDDYILRVFVGQKVATVSANIVDSPDHLAERAVAMAKVAPDDHFAGLADAEQLSHEFIDLELYDASVPSVDILSDHALRAEESGLSVQNITNSGGVHAAWNCAGFSLATSNGFLSSHLTSQHSISANMIAGEGTAMERDHDYTVACHMHDLSQPETIGRQAAERAVRRLLPRKMDTIKGALVYEPRAAASLLSHFAGAISGSVIARKTSFLQDAFDHAVFPSHINILDEPQRLRGLRSRPFDGEGLSSQALYLVEDGILRHFLLDLASARELGIAANGRAGRGAGAPYPTATNLALMPGSEGPETLIKSVKEGLYITDLIGHGVNAVTGDYSRGASGFRIENGQLTYPVSEMTVAGNLRDMYAHLVPASDLEWKFAINAPTVLIEDVTIAGR